MEKLSQQDRYQLMKEWLNERQWRLYVATEARRIGGGGISQIAREADVNRKIICKGIRELKAGVLYQLGGRVRKPGMSKLRRSGTSKTTGGGLRVAVSTLGGHVACLATTSVTHVGCADETRRCFCSYRVSAVLYTALASLRIPHG